MVITRTNTSAGAAQFTTQVQKDNMITTISNIECSSRIEKEILLVMSRLPSNHSMLKGKGVTFF